MVLLGFIFRTMANSTGSQVSVGHCLHQTLERIAAASKARASELQNGNPRLVAVTKTKPVSMILEAYDAGQRHFGENYVEELVEKSQNFEILDKCPDIKWHYIGHLQKNKVKKVLGVPNLFMLETIHNTKLANSVNSSWERLGNTEPLNVMIQVNTSTEPHKHGCTPVEVNSLAQHIIDTCSSLHFIGLMTIGAFGHDLANGPNPDFQCLIKCKQEMCAGLGLDPKSVELSMGMSHDFEHAIDVGSTNVRVGSTIFGEREKKESGSKKSDTPNTSNAES